MKAKQLKEARLKELEDKAEELIRKNRDEVGKGRSITEIEDDILSGIIDFGRSLLNDRIIGEEQELEDKGFDVEKKTSE